MLLILLALDHDTIWVVPGSEVSQQNLWITLGSQRDEAWGVSQVGLVLMEHFRNSSFPSISMQDAILQYGGNYIVEELSHAQLDSEFAAIGLQLDRPISVPDAVDSVLRWRDHQWRVQEKATHRQNGDGRYHASLWKHGGCLGRLAYTKPDFDILFVSLRSGR